MISFIPRFFWTLALLVSLIFVGTTGYLVIEDQSLGDALYMTAITLTAVGYEEVWPLSPPGRVFTMVLLLGGITWLGFWFASLTSIIVEMDLKDELRKRRMSKRIKNMKDHVIICGAGRTGRQVAQEIDSFRHDYVVVERDPTRIAVLQDYVPDAPAIEGDATHDPVLLEAGLADAKALVTCLSADTDNLFVCLSARDLAAKVTIVARAYEEDTIDKLYRAGADHVVSPNVSSALRMASVILRPSAVSFIDIATRASHLALRMEQVTIEENSAVAGRTLAEAEIPGRTGLIVIAIRRTGQHTPEFEFNPSGETRVLAGDEVIVLGQLDQIEKLRQVLG